MNTHDDLMALDIDSLLELELQHTEGAEQHRDLTPLGPEPAAGSSPDPDRADSPQDTLSQQPPRVRAPGTHLSNALRRHHPTHEASKGPTEYWASLERDLPDVTGQGLHGYATTLSSPGAPAQEWEEVYAIDVTDMMAYVERVEKPEQDTILRFLAYQSWRWGHQVTHHGPQNELTSGPRSRRQSGTSSSTLPRSASISSHTAEYLMPRPLHRRYRWPSPRRMKRTHPPTATTGRKPHQLTKRHLPHNYHATNDSRGRRTLPLQWASPEGSFMWG